MKLNQDISFINMYGQTETTGIVCVYPIKVSNKKTDQTVSIKERTNYLKDKLLHTTAIRPRAEDSFAMLIGVSFSNFATNWLINYSISKG